MHPLRLLLLAIDIIGGAAVLGSYAVGIRSHDNPGAALWGGVPEAIRPVYTASMLSATVGYLVFTSYLLRIDPDATRVGPWGYGVLIVLHLGIRTLATYADPIIVPAIATLNILGLAMIHRLDLADLLRAQRNGSEPPAPDVNTQLTWTALGMVLFLVVLFVVRDHRTLQRYTYTAMFAGIVLLLLPLAPGIGAEINGARLWVRLGQYSFQPSEIAKILLTIFFAGYLTVTRDSLALVRTKVMGIERTQDSANRIVESDHHGDVDAPFRVGNVVTDNVADSHVLPPQRVQNAGYCSISPIRKRASNRACTSKMRR